MLLCFLGISLLVGLTIEHRGFSCGSTPVSAGTVLNEIDVFHPLDKLQAHGNVSRPKRYLMRVASPHNKGKNRALGARYAKNQTRGAFTLLFSVLIPLNTAVL